jgi:hypothetical protein
MKPLPRSDHSLVLRTDFSNQPAWAHVRAEISRPVGIFRFRANVHFVDDPDFANLSSDQILELMRGMENTFIIVADNTTMSAPDHPLLILDSFGEPGREIRAVPSAVQAIENNLSLGNMDFEDFADSVDTDGIFRDFPR